MGFARRRFTISEKLDILKQADQQGTMMILRKYNLSYSVFHRWKKEFSEESKEENQTISPIGINRLKELEEENMLLKKIIANQAMLLELKEEELRKHKP